jgi:hypothetical protein
VLYDPKYDLDETGLTLWAAAEYIELYGWVQGAGFSPRDSMYPSVCALMAIEMVTEGNIDLMCSAVKRLQNHLHGGRIDAWNDAEVRTKQEVIDGLRQSATGLA